MHARVPKGQDVMTGTWINVGVNDRGQCNADDNTQSSRNTPRCIRPVRFGPAFPMCG